MFLRDGPVLNLMLFGKAPARVALRVQFEIGIAARSAGCGVFSYSLMRIFTITVLRSQVRLWPRYVEELQWGKGVLCCSRLKCNSKGQERAKLKGTK